jgi:phage recombination protein Bet
MATEEKKAQAHEVEGELVSVPTKENASVEIIPFGTTDRIRLSAAIVRQMIATKTRTGKEPDDNQCIKFIMLCKARHLNPFEGDAFMLGYDTQSGPQWSLITAHQVFLKRAEASKGFNGMESGVIVKLSEGGILEREGDLVYDEEKLIGGWAKVYRKDREKPFYRRLKLATFNTGRSRWEKDPAGMICKCAEADSLRTAFPTHLGGLYIEEEAHPIDAGGEIQIQRPKIRVLKNQKAHSGSGSETTSGEGDGAANTGDATTPTTDEPNGSQSAAPSNEPAPEKPKGKKKLQGLKSEPEGGVQVGPNEQKMMMRLEALKLSKDDLVTVARQLDAVDPSEGWDQIEEQKFGVLLVEANWSVVEEELKHLRK